MKILYVITKSNFGGAQRYVFDLASEMKAKNIEVHVACGGNGLLIDKLNALQIPVHTIPSFQREVNMLKEIKAFFEILRLYKQLHPDVIHLNSSKAGGLGSFAARIYNIGRKRIHHSRIVFTAHGWAFTENKSGFSKTTRAFLHWLTVKFAHITIAVSRETRHEILDAFPNISHKVHVVHNGIPPFDLLYPRDARKELLEFTSFHGAIDVWSTQTLWLGSIAELHPNKDLETAIEAVAHLSRYFHEHNVSLAYFIMGEGEERERLEKIIRAKKLTSTIFLLGHVPDARRYLRAFDIFLLTSHKEGLPYVILEAGYAGIPVIASETGGVSDVVHDGTSGILCAPGKPEEFSAAILEYAKSPEKRLEHGLHLKENVSHNFTLDHMVKKTLTIYTSYAYD